MGFFEELKNVYTDFPVLMPGVDLVKLVFGGCLGAYLNHRLALSRDRNEKEQARTDRRRDALTRAKVALASLRASLQRPPFHDLSTLSTDDLPEALAIALEQDKRDVIALTAAHAELAQEQAKLPSSEERALEMRRAIEAHASSVGGRQRKIAEFEHKMKMLSALVKQKEDSWAAQRDQMLARLDRQLLAIERLVSSNGDDNELELALKGTEPSSKTDAGAQS